VQEKEEAGGIAVMSGGYHEVDVAVLDEHVGHAVVVHNRILSLRIGLQQKEKQEELGAREWECEIRFTRERKRWNLFFDEFGEEAFGVEGGDVAAVVAPDEDAAFDVEEEQSRGCPCHWSWIPIRSTPPSTQKEEEGLLYNVVVVSESSKLTNSLFYLFIVFQATEISNNS